MEVRGFDCFWSALLFRSQICPILIFDNLQVPVIISFKARLMSVFYHLSIITKSGGTMKLFEPITINGMELKNRIVMPPMQLSLGMKNRRARAYYMERARGGAGAIIMAAASVDLFLYDKTWGRPDGVARFVEAMQTITDELRATGAKIGIQIWHGNEIPPGVGMPNQPGAELVAPSATDEAREITVDEIRSIIDKFAGAAAKAKEAGFDFVELHGAHGYMLCKFFSGADNMRTDEWGGSLQGRMKFGVEAVRAVRAAVGDDYPICYRFPAEEKFKGGITLSQSKKFAVELEKAGVDVLNVSHGSTRGGTGAPTKRSKMGAYVYMAEAVKEKVSIPVIGVGRINTSEVAEEILKNNRADLVAIGRQLIADPYWPQKVQEGRESEIVACESCNTCFIPFRGVRKWKIGDPICKVNERAGREIDFLE